MKPIARMLRALAVIGVLATVLATPAFAATRPAVTGLSTHRGAYWGGALLSVHGRGFVDVQGVWFGTAQASSVDVVSTSTIRVRVPWHEYGTVHVRVVTAGGETARSSADEFRFAPPTMTTPIQGGGLTARQEQRISARVRAAHKGVRLAPAARGWTPAMGVTALRRARSWLGLPYSWAGGSGHGPTTGVCAHNGGDLDCHVVGFDCSGLTMYAWWPYRQLAHYAATQHSTAGRYHPAIGELMPGDLVFFSAYIPNGIGHVAIYAGHGMVVQAEQSGTQIMRSRLSDVIAYSGSYRGATRPASLGRQGSGPRVSSVTSALPTRGGYITVRGSHLDTVTSVSVGGTLRYSFAERTPRRLLIKVPAHIPGTVSVAVSDAWGTVRTRLSYIAAPSISALRPAEGPTTGGNTVTVVGRHLASVTEVTIGSTPVPFDVVTAKLLTVTMPDHAAGTVAVTLHSPFGTSNKMSYAFLDPVPPSSPPPSP